MTSCAGRLGLARIGNDTHMTFDAVLFDLDDTLHDKSATLQLVASSLYRQAGFEEAGIDAQEWQATFLDLNRLRIEKTEVFLRLRQRFRFSVRLEDTLREEYDRYLGSVAQPFAGAVELLASCKLKGLRTGIVTNGRDAFQRSKIAGLGIEPLVDTIVTSGGFGSKKPDHAIFRHCLQMLNVAPQNAVFIGDDFYADMIPAYELGMLPLWKSSSSAPSVAYSSDSLSAIQAFLFKRSDWH